MSEHPSNPQAQNVHTSSQCSNTSQCSDTSSRSNTPLQSTFTSLQSLRCPICSKRFAPSDEGVAMPFCSMRCKQIDLGRWLGEAYGLPYVPLEDDDEA